MPNNKSAGAADEIAKLFTKAHRKEELKIVYKETSAKGRMHTLCESVMAYYPVGGQALLESRPRLFFTLTTTSADCMIQVEGSAPSQVTRATKELVLGSGGLLQWEKLLAPETRVPLFHHEKAEEVTQYILHHFGVGSACILSGGSVTVIQAAMRR